MADIILTYNEVNNNVTVQETVGEAIVVQVITTGLRGPAGESDPSFVIAMAIALGG